jgi:hypothetical protein
MRFKEKELTHAFHPVFDPVAAVNRRVAHVAIQRRLGILSQRWPGSYSLNRVTGRFAPLGRWIGFSEDDSDSPKALLVTRRFSEVYRAQFLIQPLQRFCLRLSKPLKRL